MFMIVLFYLTLSLAIPISLMFLVPFTRLSLLLLNLSRTSSFLDVSCFRRADGSVNTRSGEGADYASPKFFFRWLRKLLFDRLQIFNSFFYESCALFKTINIKISRVLYEIQASKAKRLHAGSAFCLAWKNSADI